MIDRFANLTACCNGNLSIENLERFQLAMREYEVFMTGMRELLAPIPDPPPGFMELAGAGIERPAKPKQNWRIVVRYDDPRGGIWRGPLEDRASALARAESESAVVRGSVTLEQVGEQT